jgi:hypothetical protein
MPTTMINSGSCTWLLSSTPTTPRYSTTQLAVGSSPSDVRRALLRFDLTSIPAGSTIDASELALYQHPRWADMVPQSIHLATSLWVQTQATWNSRWTGAAWVTPGGDFALSPSAILQPTQTGGAYITANVLALVQASWVSGANALDVLIKLADEAMLDSVDYDPFVAAFPPELTVDYTPPEILPGPARLTVGLAVGIGQ